MELGYGKNDNLDLDNQDNENDVQKDNEQKEDLNDEKHQYDENGNPIDNLNDKDNNDSDEDKDKNNNDDDNKNDIIELKTGEIVEIGENKYTVGENGDLLDKDGKVFKEAKDVQEYLKTLDRDENGDDDDKNKSEININNLKEALGYNIVDENDKEIEYDNSIEGIKNYVNDVVEQQYSEIQEATLNGLFNKYPFVKDAINYYLANGNNLEGWGVDVDRSNITIDENNEQQQEEIIRTAWKEQHRTGDINGYIEYLKSSGTLLNTAKIELDGLKAADESRKQDMAKRAREESERAANELNEFWNNVANVIKNRKIAGYQIPEQIKITRNGKTLMVGPEEFYRYISVADKNGETAYARDCKAVNPEQQLNDNLLRAYLMFSGGSYESLVDMAIKEKEVKTIKFKAQNDKKTSHKFTPKNDNKNKSIDLGYN